jgi:hypothetical protein
MEDEYLDKVLFVYHSYLECSEFIIIIRRNGFYFEKETFLSGKKTFF